MKQFIDQQQLGGLPIFNNDFRDILQNPFYDILRGWMIKNRYKCLEGWVFSGCEVTANGSNFDVAPGVIFLNDDFYTYEGDTNVPAGYLVPDTDVIETRVFKDGSVKNVAVTKKAIHTTVLPTFPDQCIFINHVDNRAAWRNINDTNIVLNEVVTVAGGIEEFPETKVRKTIDGTVEIFGALESTNSYANAVFLEMPLELRMLSDNAVIGGFHFKGLSSSENREKYSLFYKKGAKFGISEIDMLGNTPIENNAGREFYFQVKYSLAQI